MDATQLSRWTRFASKGGIGKCIALQDCVAREPDDLMFLKDDEITVLMQLPDEDGIYLGYCEGVVGRFAAACVLFNGKLKTPVITKRSSSQSKSPRPRSLTPSRKRPPSQGSAPSISRTPSRAEDPFTFPRSASPPSTIPNSLSLDSRQSPILTHHDSLVTSSTSHSSSSSTQDSHFPPTPSDSYVEPLAKDKTIPTTVPDLDTSQVSDNVQKPLRVVPLSSPQQEPAPGSPRSFVPDSVPRNVPLDTAGVLSQPSDAAAPALPHVPPLTPSTMEPALVSGPRTGVNDATSDRMSRVSAAMSDGAADIGLFMLQGFIAGNNADDDDDGDNDDGDDDEDGDDISERTSLKEAVDGFPAPPTQIPTASSQATSFVLDAPRPPSALSDYSEEGDGASFYDNYRYSRLSISSKLSKSSAHAPVTVPPPIPTELPPSVRHSLESQRSVPPSPLANSMPTSPLSQGMMSPVVRPQTRTVPPPLVLGSNSSYTAVPNPSTATTASPLLHTNFASPQSSPPTGSNTTTIRSPMSSVFDVRGGAASALRQRIESDRAGSSPLASPLPSATSQERTFEQSQSIVVADREEDTVPSHRASQPRTPTSPVVSTTSSSGVTLEKKRGVPAPLVVMNPAPPPPYTPTSPLTLRPLATPTSPTYSPMPSPVIPRISPQPTAEPGPSQSRTSLFLPHPNAPKPTVTSQGPLYWCSVPPVPPPPAHGLIQALRRASQMRVGPNGLPQFSTIYGSTTQDLSTSVGPVPIFFSTDPPNDVPANRMRMANSLAAPPTPIAPPPQSTSPSQGGLRPPPERHASTSNLNVVPRPNFVPKAATLRPRSRSFSGFDSPMIPGVQSKVQSRDEASVAHVARPSTADSEPSPRSNSMAARAAVHTSRIHQARQYTPSPLALSQATSGQGQGSKPGFGSLPLVVSVPPSPSRTKSSPISPTTLRHMLTPELARNSQSKSSTLEREAETPASPTTLKDTAPPSIQIYDQESQASLEIRQQPGGPIWGKTSMNTEGSHLGDSRSQVQVASPPLAAPLPASASGPSLVRNTSLRSKISLSALRSRSLREDRQQQDDGLREGETVQVMDTDFELVRPALSRPRASEDSSANGKSSGSEGRPSFLRIDSPATSLASGGASDTRSPVSPSAPTLPPPGAKTAAAPAVPIATVEAHRALELKWIAVMAATPSALARKSKKIRRLLQEGVPASVRYQVWAHLADSRAKRIEGLYAQLGERERVRAFADIQRDAQNCFSRDKRLAQPDGPLVSLLQSYLIMVPDIQYSKGLAFIAGQLLLQSPEEDAFWIFISLMDTHLRPYFSSNSVQLEIDASLFAKALESVDSSIAKRLFVDMGIAPIRICRPWFTSLFVEALPTEYFQRVWDIFLSEGVVFLFRIGLALVTCCQRSLRDTRTEADALAILAHPPPFLLASSPGALIELSSSFRLKDDEIRKQRVKLEARIKRQTQSRLSNAARRGSQGSRGNLSNTGHGIASAAITLPSKS